MRAIPTCSDALGLLPRHHSITPRRQPRAPQQLQVRTLVRRPVAAGNLVRTDCLPGRTHELSDHEQGDRGTEDPPGESPVEPPGGHAEPDQYQTLRRRFRAATDAELDPQSFIMADDRAAVRAVLRGGSIGADRGDAEFIGGAIRRIGRALRETAQMYRQVGQAFIDNALLREFAWGSSVVLGLEISAAEDVQL